MRVVIAILLGSALIAGSLIYASARPTNVRVERAAPVATPACISHHYYNGHCSPFPSQ